MKTKLLTILLLVFAGVVWGQSLFRNRNMPRLFFPEIKC